VSERKTPEGPGGEGRAGQGQGRPAWPEFWSDPVPAGGSARESAPANGSGAQAPAQPAPETAAQPPEPRAAADSPRTVGPLEAFVRHPIVTLFPIVLLAAAAVYVGLDRAPEYTAKARINVGRTDVPPFVLQNVVGGNQALAASYSRAISAAPVAVAAARATGRTPADARDHLDATPIPGSTLIQVEAKGPAASDAIALSNAGARALISYVALVSRDRKSAGALRRFRIAQAQAQRLQRRLTSLQTKGAKRKSDVARVQVDLDAAQLRASNLANLYRASTGAGDGGSPLNLIAPAATAGSDRKTTLERLILIAVAAGLVLGLGLALLVANRRKLRSMRE
jgi:hypothetical protein